MFGTLRKPGSGSQGRGDQTRSDSMHERLFIECKSRKKCATRSLVNDARAKAKKEGKLATVIVERETGKPGAILSVHDSEWPIVVAEWLLANMADFDDSESAYNVANQIYAIRNKPNATL